MKKLFTLLCAMLLAVQFTSAQRQLYVIDKNGCLTSYPASSVSFGDGIFSIAFTQCKTTGVTAESFSSSVEAKFKSDKVKSFKNVEIGVCYSDGDAVPTVNDDCITVASALTSASVSFTVSSLNARTFYHYRPYAKLGDYVYYGDAVKVRTLGTVPDSKTVDGHKFVDLGLPSGLLWAEANIGAETAGDDGDYFAWGETAAKSSYLWSNYKHGSSESEYVYAKYNETDGKSILEQEDDAAYVNWGSYCRMPTYNEMSELMDTDYCTWTWTSRTNSLGNTINGYTITSLKNGNSIFLPASGYRDEDYNDDIVDYNEYGYYSTSDLRTSPNVTCAYYLRFSDHAIQRISTAREHGIPVRPVAEP